MGEDKALLPFGSYDTLAEYQYIRLSKLFSKVYISCKDPSKFSFNAEYVVDDKSITTYAPTLGFISAFASLNAESFFALSVDTPFVGVEEIEKILNADSISSDATIARTDSGIQPLCGIYHRSLEQSFTAMQNENRHRLGYLLKDAKTTFVPFEDAHPFTNLNHPHEYREAYKESIGSNY